MHASEHHPLFYFMSFSSILYINEFILLSLDRSISSKIARLNDLFKMTSGGGSRCGFFKVCVVYYTTYYEALCAGGGGESQRTCAMRDDEPMPVWTSLPITHNARKRQIV
jgi:hypothetical protein